MDDLHSSFTSFNHIKTNLVLVNNVFAFSWLSATGKKLSQTTRTKIEKILSNINKEQVNGDKAKGRFFGSIAAAIAAAIAGAVAGGAASGWMRIQR